MRIGNLAKIPVIAALVVFVLALAGCAGDAEIVPNAPGGGTPEGTYRFVNLTGYDLTNLTYAGVQYAYGIESDTDTPQGKFFIGTHEFRADVPGHGNVSFGETTIDTGSQTIILFNSGTLQNPVFSSRRIGTGSTAGGRIDVTHLDPQSPPISGYVTTAEELPTPNNRIFEGLEYGQTSSAIALSGSGLRTLKVSWTGHPIVAVGQFHIDAKYVVHAYVVRNKATNQPKVVTYSYFVG